MEIIVYTTNLTNRVKYAFSLVIKNVLGHKPVFVTSVEELHSSQFPKINYSENIFENALNIVPHSLLFENGIQKQNIQVEKINNIFFFFRTSGNNAFPHDIFAAAFYLATRYEEYLPHLKDKMGRFCITNSLAFKENFLDEPVINQWAEKLLFFLNENQQIKIHDNRIFSFLPTIDIDNPWAYLHKGRFRSIAGAVRDLLRGKTKLVALRKKVLAGKEKDPYDTFSVLKEIHEKFSLKPVYFFLVGKYNKYGKNPSAKKKPYRKLIKSIAENNITGIHPSFPSNIYFKELGNEITVLKKTTKKKITKSRHAWKIYHHRPKHLPRQANFSRNSHHGLAGAGNGRRGEGLGKYCRRVGRRDFQRSDHRSSLSRQQILCPTRT